MKSWRVMVLLIAVIFMNKCASTTLNSVKSFDFHGKKLKKILVVAPFWEIGRRKDSENAFSSRFKSLGGCAESSINLFPPLKNYSNKEIKSILKKNNIDGILVVALQDYWTKSIYVPGGSSTQGNVILYGNSLYFQSYTQEFGGYYISKPRVTFEIRLYDVVSNEMIWLATTYTKGNALAKLRTLINSLAKKVVGELSKENIIEFRSNLIKKKNKKKLFLFP